MSPLTYFCLVTVWLSKGLYCSSVPQNGFHDHNKLRSAGLGEAELELRQRQNARMEEVVQKRFARHENLEEEKEALRHDVISLEEGFVRCLHRVSLLMLVLAPDLGGGLTGIVFLACKLVT